MRAYIARRFVVMIPTAVLVAFITFSLVRLVPGDVLAARMDESGVSTPEAVALMREELGLDRPFFVQFGHWMWGIVRGDLGKSLYSETPVISEIKVRLPVSIELGLISFGITISIATLIGVLSAIRQDTIIDYATRVTAIGFVSVPNFWIATIVILLPAIWWAYSAPLGYVSPFEDPWGTLRQFLPPGLILGLGSVGATMRLTRSSLLEVLRQDYIRTAQAKGLAERTIIRRHALKNSLIPVVTLWGSYFSNVVGGSVIIENVYGLPGMGQMLVQSIVLRDYTQVQALVLIMAVVTLLLNLAVDLIYGLLDPRIQYK
jgi:peptide/nickel transport system permease protein